MMTDLNADSVIARQLAKKYTTSSDTLERLKDHKDLEVRRLVALNPNASKQTLFTLSDDYPNEVVGNSSLNLLLEDCDDLAMQVIVARSSTASAKQLTAFANSRQKTLLIAVGRNPNTPAHVLERLILEPQPIDVPKEEVSRLDFSARRQCPDEFFDSYDDSYTIRSLRHKYQEEVIVAIASNPNFPIRLMGFLMHYSKTTRMIEISAQSFCITP